MRHEGSLLCALASAPSSAYISVSPQVTPSLELPQALCLPPLALTLEGKQLVYLSGQEGPSGEAAGAAPSVSPVSHAGPGGRDAQ